MIGIILLFACIIVALLWSYKKAGCLGLFLLLIALVVAFIIL